LLRSRAIFFAFFEENGIGTGIFLWKFFGEKASIETASLSGPEPASSSFVEPP